MSAFAVVRVVALVLATPLPFAVADIISDITTSESDESSALNIKAEMFWKPILSAAEDVHMEKHLALYADADKVITSLPAENEYVRKTLTEALDHLKKADAVSFKHALASSRVAKEKLDDPYGSSGIEFSFLTGGQNFLKAALNKFIGGSSYPEKLKEHVSERQADILPVLRGASNATGNILKDSRLASSKAFDVLKYNSYNSDVPKTPKVAADLADRIVAAAGETRHHFTKSITDMANSIAKDENEKHEDASVTVTKVSLRGFHTSVAAAEARFASAASTSQLHSLFSSSRISIV